METQLKSLVQFNPLRKILQRIQQIAEMLQLDLLAVNTNIQ